MRVCVKYILYYGYAPKCLRVGTNRPKRREQRKILIGFTLATHWNSLLESISTQYAGRQKCEIEFDLLVKIEKHKLVKIISKVPK